MESTPEVSLATDEIKTKNKAKTKQTTTKLEFI